MPYVFQRICTFVMALGLVKLTKLGLEGQGKEPSPEFAKRIVTIVMDTLVVRTQGNKKRDHMS